MKYWTLGLLLFLLLVFFAKRESYAPRFHIIGELPPLEERVPPHLKEKARAQRLQEERQKPYFKGPVP